MQAPARYPRNCTPTAVSRQRSYNSDPECAPIQDNELVPVPSARVLSSQQPRSAAMIKFSGSSFVPRHRCHFQLACSRHLAQSIQQSNHAAQTQQQRPSRSQAAQVEEESLRPREPIVTQRARWYQQLSRGHRATDQVYSATNHQYLSFQSSHIPSRSSRSPARLSQLASTCSPTSCTNIGSFSQ